MGAAQTRITLFGTLGNGLDNWSCGFSTPPDTSPTPADMNTLALVALGLFSTGYWSDFVTAISPSVILVGAKAADIQTDGTTNVTGESILATPYAGTSTYKCLPPEVSLCVSLRTPYSGASYRGRMYLPPLDTRTCDDSGAVITGTRNDVGASMKTFFDDWNADSATQPVGVASNKLGVINTVTQVWVGNVWDSQRRRRNSIPESYTVEDLA